MNNLEKSAKVRKQVSIIKAILHKAKSKGIHKNMVFVELGKAHIESIRLNEPIQEQYFTQIEKFISATR